MQPSILLFRGIEGSPDENWFPWLKKEMAARGVKMEIPTLPSPNAPRLQEWMEYVERNITIDKDTILIGHSLGATFALRLLERLKHPVLATFLIAPVSDTSCGKDYAPLLRNFLETPFDAKTIMNNGGNISIYYSENDPFIPIDSSKYLASALYAKTKMIPGAGHFNASAGYDEFPALLEHLEGFITQ